MIHPESRPFLVVVHGPEPAGVSRTSVSFSSPVKAARATSALLFCGFLGCRLGGLFSSLGGRFLGRRLLGSLLLSHGSDLRPIGASGLASTIEAIFGPPIPPWHTDNYPATHNSFPRCVSTMPIHALLSLVLYCIWKKFQSPLRVIFVFFVSLHPSSLRTSAINCDIRSRRVHQIADSYRLLRCVKQITVHFRSCQDHLPGRRNA